jgi:hypothetical protein
MATAACGGAVRPFFRQTGLAQRVFEALSGLFQIAREAIGGFGHLFEFFVELLLQIARRIGGLARAPIRSPHCRADSYRGGCEFFILVTSHGHLLKVGPYLQYTSAALREQYVEANARSRRSM